MPPAALAGAPGLPALVAAALEGARLPAVVVTDGDLALPAADEVVVVRVGDALPDPSELHVRTLLLVVEDVVALRRAVARVGDLGSARVVGVVVRRCEAAVPLRALPSWPAVTDLHARTLDGGAVTRVELAARVRVTPVLAALARAAALPVPAGHRGVRVATTYDAEDTVPPDAVLDGPAELPTSPVTGRAPVVIGDLDEPLDEAVLNPVGFRREWVRGMVDLPGDTRLTAALVRELRDAQGVHLPPDADPVLVAGLAMAGVPTVAIEDPLERERHSVRTRREALLRHSTFAWRARVAERGGVRGEPLPEDDLELAWRYTGADLVVMPDADDGPTECFVEVPPPGRVRHDRTRTPDEVVAAGGLVYVTHSRAVG